MITLNIQKGIASEYTSGVTWVEKILVGSDACRIEKFGDRYEITSGKVSSVICKSEFPTQDVYFEQIDRMIDLSKGSTCEFITDEDCYYVEIQFENESKLVEKVKYSDTYFC